MKFIYSRYDRNVSGLFETLQYVFMISMTILLVALYMLISHLVNYNYSNINDQALCAPFLPCALLVSRFGESEKSIYSFTMVLIVIFLFITLIRKWSDFKKKDVMQNLFDNDQIAYCKIFFDSWDWKVNSAKALDNQRHKLTNLFVIGIAEKETK
jgi:preprotein translocase subunit SecG